MKIHLTYPQRITVYGVKPVGRPRVELRPKQMVSRMEAAIENWIKSCSAGAFPGRSVFNHTTCANLRMRTANEIYNLERVGWLPPERELDSIFLETFPIVYKWALEHQTSYLAVEAALSFLWRAAFNCPDIDIYREEKENLDEFFLCRLGRLDRLLERPSDLSAWLEVVLKGNHFGSRRSHAALVMEEYIDFNSFFKRRLTYYLDHRAKVVQRLSQPLKIVYVLDNAGESLLDLRLMEKLASAGHHLTVVAKRKPVLNDVTYDEIKTTLAMPAFAYLASRITVLPGWDIAGVYLNDCSDEVKATFNKEDMVILKGEGNFESLPPEENYSFDLVYILITKTPGLNHSLDGRLEPSSGQGIIYFKPAEK